MSDELKKRLIAAMEAYCAWRDDAGSWDGDLIKLMDPLEEQLQREDIL